MAHPPLRGTPLRSYPPVPARWGSRLQLQGHVFAIAVLVAAGGRAPAFPEQDPPLRPDEARQFLRTYCLSCHGEGAKIEGDVDMRPLLGGGPVGKHLAEWRDIRDQLEIRAMPPSKPAGLPRPAAADYDRMRAWISASLAGESSPSGRFVRRLNRAQYNNTVRDLLGVDIAPADAFPQDLGLEGFDSIANVQSISPMLFEKYQKAARDLVRLALVTESQPATTTTTYYPVDRDQRDAKSGIKPSPTGLHEWAGRDREKAYETSPVKFLGLDHSSGSPGDKRSVREGRGAHGYEVVLPPTGRLERRGSIAFRNPLEYGRYKVRVKAYAEPARDRKGAVVEPRSGCVMGVDVNNRRKFEFAVPVTGEPRVFEFEFESDFAGTRLDIGAASEVRRSMLDHVPRLVLCEIELAGPIRNPWPPRSHRLVCGEAPVGDFHGVLAHFLPRAFRRPVSNDEIARYAAVASAELAAGAKPADALAAALEAVLCSPSFLYLVEDRRPGGHLGEFETAARLSYFLWGSMPDDRLFEVAAQGRLRIPSVLQAEARRMLADPRAEALVQDFAGQWLGLRRISDIAPDPGIFKDWDEALRKAMRAESEYFFRDVMREDRPVFTFLDSDFTYLNDRLAAHYGIPGVEGAAMRRVSLPPDSERGGVAAHAGILAVHSQPTRSSPVMRGVFILEKLFNRPPPNPPADVPQIPASSTEPSPASLRQQLALHAADPSCASCHERIDPWGLPLERFNGIGALRAASPADLTAQIPGGGELTGPAGLRKELMARRDQFLRGFTEKLLLYALGRALEPADERHLPPILAHATRGQFRFSALINAIVTSPPFLTR